MSFYGEAIQAIENLFKATDEAILLVGDSQAIIGRLFAEVGFGSLSEADTKLKQAIELLGRVSASLAEAHKRLS